jgi:glutathione S-transferase
MSKYKAAQNVGAGKERIARERLRIAEAQFRIATDLVKAAGTCERYRYRQNGDWDLSTKHNLEAAREAFAVAVAMFNEACAKLA